MKIPLLHLSPKSVTELQAVAQQHRAELAMRRARRDEDAYMADLDRKMIQGLKEINPLYGNDFGQP